MHTSFSHGASLSPKRPTQNRGDSGVSAAVWEWLGPMHTPFSHKASLSLKGPGKTGGTRVYPPLCGSGYTLCILRSPTGRPYTPSGPGRTGGTQVYPPLCGSGCTLCILRSPTGLPYLGGLKCIRRCVGVAGPYAYLLLPRGVPIHQAAKARPEGLGCIRRCVGVARPCVSSLSHGPSLSPKRPRQDRRESGASDAVWRWLGLVYPRSPTGHPYPPSGRGSTAGTRVYLPLCGGGWTLCILVLPRGVSIPQAA